MSQQSQAQSESREQHYQQLDRTERQQTRRYIILPFLLVVLLMVVMVAIVLSLRTATQVAVISDFMFTLFVLCPLVICMFPIVILMIVLVALMNRLHAGTKSPLRRLEQWTYKMEQQVDDLARIVDSRVLNWAVRFAPIRRILTIFDTPSSGSQDEIDNHGTTRTDQ